MSEKSVGEVNGSDPLNEIFSGPMDGRDLAEMVARDGKPLITRFTIFLSVVALVLGGVIVGAHFKTSGTSANASAANFESLRSAFASQGSSLSGAAPTFGGFGAPTAAGQIKLIDGTNIYVTTDTGSIVKVSTDATTRIRQSATLTIGQLKIGDTVSVSGQDGADGTVAATSINVEGAQTGAGTPSAAATAPSPSTAPKSSAPTPTKSATPSGTTAPRIGSLTALTACLTKAGVKVDPTQGIRGLRNSSDPKVQAALAACRTTP